MTVAFNFKNFHNSKLHKIIHLLLFSCRHLHIYFCPTLLLLRICIPEFELLLFLYGREDFQWTANKSIIKIYCNIRGATRRAEVGDLPSPKSGRTIFVRYLTTQHWMYRVHAQKGTLRKWIFNASGDDKMQKLPYRTCYQ